MQIPTNATAWLEIETIFNQVWNFPHCVGAIDGKHIVLQSPINSGTEFFNYKSFFSIVLMALVDANYNFLFADVGCQGRISDGGVLKDSLLYQMMSEGTIGFPKEKEFPGRTIKIPYFIVGDSAFSMNKNLWKPFPGEHEKGTAKRVFNYRLSRARRVVENAFGIISSVFRILRRPMLLKPEKAQIIVMACLHLHNYLRKHSPNIYSPRESFEREENGIFVEGSWRHEQDMTSLFPLTNVPRRAKVYYDQIRNEVADYFLNEGAVEWQNSYA